MDLRATKDQYERESDEAERLVRPSPKLKPPRHDRRRERVDSEDDPDLKGNRAEDDPDLSLNYKGRSAAVVLARYLAAKDKQVWVAVINTETGESTRVTKETLKEKPGKYKVVEKDDDQGGEVIKPQPIIQVGEPSKPKPEPKPEPKPVDSQAVAAHLTKLLDAGHLDAKAISRMRQNLQELQAYPFQPQERAALEQGIAAALGLPGLTAEALGKALEDNPDLGKPKGKPKGKKPAEAAPAQPEATPAEPDDKELTKRLIERAKKDPALLAELQKELALEPKKPAETVPEKPAEPEEIELGDEDIIQEPDAQAAKRVVERVKKAPPPLPKPKKPPAPEKPAAKDVGDKGTETLDPEDRKALNEWVKEGGPDSDAFKKYVSAIKTVREKDGKNLFLDPKSNKHVEFDALPDAEKVAIKKQFDSKAKLDSNVKGFKPLLKENPKLQQVLKELADPKSALAQSLAKEGKPEHLDPIKSVPALKGVRLPPGIDTLRDLMSAAAEINKPPPAMKRREVTPREQVAADNSLRINFPSDVAEKLIAAKTHPDDVKAMVEGYQQMSKGMENMPPKELRKMLQDIRGEYQPDPDKIQPPASVPSEDGKSEVPWDELEPEQQAEELQRHKNRILAMSLAARKTTADTIAKATKAPAPMAAKLADFTLNQPEGESPEMRRERGQAMAEEMFSEVMRSGSEPEPMSEKDVRKSLEALADDPAAQEVAVGYFQARDYQLARQKFLDMRSEDMISEFQSPAKIFKGMQKATAFLRERTKAYPRGIVGPDVADLFRDRVLGRLRTLDPDKAKEVEKAVIEQRGKDYEDAKAEYDKLSVKLKPKHEELKKKVEELTAKYVKESGDTDIDTLGPYRAAPEGARNKAKRPDWLLKAERELADYEQDMPKEPKAPEGYAPKGGKGSIWQRVKKRFQRQKFSTCTHGNAMDRAAARRRLGVYWGVAPTKTPPYPEWSQAHQRDLGKGDYDGLLTAARVWLKTPVLAREMDGVVRDTQLRAALDLAIRDHEGGRYSAGLHPAVYNLLLAKLAGESPTETLLTVRTAGKSVYAATGERITMKPSALIRAYASKIASTNPEIAFDLANLSIKVAEEEKESEQDKPEAQQKQAEQQEKKDKDEDKKEEGKPFPGAAKPFEKKEDAQQKQAYQSLRSACIRTAASNPQARAALTPVLQLIKQLG